MDDVSFEEHQSRLLDYNDSTPAARAGTPEERMKRSVFAFRPRLDERASWVLAACGWAVLGCTATLGSGGTDDLDTEAPPETRRERQAADAGLLDQRPAASPRAADGSAAESGSEAATDAGSLDASSGDAETDGRPEPSPAPEAHLCPVLSHGRGFFDAPFTLRITCPSGASAEVSYTLDGSDPRSSSTARSLPLPGEIPIDPTSTVGRKPVPAVTLRLATKPFSTAWSSVYTHTFIFPRTVLTQRNVAPNGAYWDTVMDPKIVSDPEWRDKLLPGLLVIPSVSVVMREADLFGGGGIHDPKGNNLTNRDLEKSASVELLYPPTDPRFSDFHGFQTTGAAKIQGGYSRLQGTMDTDHKQSFAIKFKETFGPKSIRYPVMESSPLEVIRKTAASKYDRLVLRSSFNESLGAVCSCFARTNFTMLRDDFVRSSYVAMTGYGSRGTFVHLYLNGIYWGLYGLLERPDHKFQAIYFGGDDTDYFSWRNKKGVVNDDQAGTGLLRWRSYHDNPDRPLAEIGKTLDIESFADWLIVGWWSGVADIQWYVGAHREGLFKYFVWDAEDSFGLGVRAGRGARINTGGNVQNGVLHGYGTNTVRENDFALAMLRKPDFLRLLTRRAKQATAPGGALSDAEAIVRWDTLVKFTELAMLAEYARWGDERSPAMTPRHWRAAVDRVRGYLRGNATRLEEVMRSRGFWRD
jgi:hypothetical protein